MNLLMGNVKQTIWRLFVVMFLMVPFLSPMIILQLASAAPTYSSTNYGVDEVFMGAGGLNDASSASYRARASLGDTGVGNSGSANYQAYGGFTTTPDPYLEFVVTNPNTDLGYITPSATATTTATFSVRTYLASGYNVVNASDPPVTGAGATLHYLNNLTTPTASATGTEQFGINLVANTAPASLGGGVSKNPQQVPDASYSFGTAAAGYNTANQYKYVKGDTVAQSTKSSGTTVYTISYIYNISAVTPAGEYVLLHSLVATSTY